MTLPVHPDAQPTWKGDVPWCHDHCPQHDGKRCRVLGLRPGTICEPMVVLLVETMKATVIT